MKKSRTTKPTKKSYSSVKELLEGEKSNIKLTPLNCEEVKFTQELSIYNPDCLDNAFKYSLRRASTSKKFFELLDNQLPNQLLYNTEEQQAYFLNSDRVLYKLLFEPVPITKEYLKDSEPLKTDYLKDQIKLLAIPWSSWNEGKYFLYGVFYELITDMFIGLLDLVKEKEIKIRCGVGMMELFYRYSRYNSYENIITIANCKIVPELDFNLEKHELVYGDVVLVGKSVPEPNIDYSSCNSNKAFKEVAEKVCPPKKKKNIWQRIFG
jgi:hypothetical protein